MQDRPFVSTDVLLPRAGFEKWACVACDQFTSEPDYWLEAARIAGDSPSALKCILPEVWLGKDDERRAEAVNAEMYKYLETGVFDEYHDAMVYIERTLADGTVRRGIVGAVDLEAYDYNPGSTSPVRATEATVIERIPPRVAIRRSAPIELPHIMLLFDDPRDSVIGNIDPEATGLKKLYDFALMLGGGRIRGWLLAGEDAERVSRALAELPHGGATPLLAVGDGNHSLASAKECYRQNPTPRNRFALAEIVNIHDPALVFEPIYRVVFGCDPTELVSRAEREIPRGDTEIKWYSGAGEGRFSVNGLPADILQKTIDGYVKERPGAYCDYVHGEDSAMTLARSGDGVIAFLFDGMDKSALFPYVAANGALPRKTFSMGEARSKRYYVEARRIDPV